MTPLDGRKNRILEAIVHDYVDTAEPIGSEWLVAHHDFGCKSATLRNEMAEMSDMGYLVQPHTSAGRIPSTRGYRYYVDCLMMPEPAESRSALPHLDASQLPVSDIVQLTARMLADITRYPSLATTPANDTVRLRRIYVTPATLGKVMVVMLLSSGHVEHRLLELGSPPGEAALQRATNYLNDILGGAVIDDVVASSLSQLPADLQRYRPIISRVHAVVRDTAHRLSDNRLFLEGATHILWQREFQDVLRLEQLLSALEQRSALYQVLSRAMQAPEVSVFIGSECSVQTMCDCSVVTSRYHIGGRHGGYIGVVGPTRMRYDRTVSAVGLMARSLSALLSRAELH